MNGLGNRLALNERDDLPNLERPGWRVHGVLPAHAVALAVLRVHQHAVDAHDDGLGHFRGHDSASEGSVSRCWGFGWHTRYLVSFFSGWLTGGRYSLSVERYMTHQLRVRHFNMDSEDDRVLYDKSFGRRARMEPRQESRESHPILTSFTNNEQESQRLRRVITTVLKIFSIVDHPELTRHGTRIHVRFIIPERIILSPELLLLHEHGLNHYEITVRGDKLYLTLLTDSQ